MDGGTVDRGAHKRNTWVRIPSLPTFNKIFSTDDCSRYIGSITYGVVVRNVHVHDGEGGGDEGDGGESYDDGA